MVNRFRVIPIALLGANNTIKNHGDIVTKDELTGSIEDLLAEGFIEEVTETTADKKAKEKAEKDAAAALLNEARKKYKELFGSDADKKLTVVEINTAIANKETKEATAEEALINARNEYKEVFNHDTDEKLSLEELQAAIEEEKAKTAGGDENKEGTNPPANPLVEKLKNK